MKPTFFDIFGELGPYAEVALLLAAIGAVVTAVAFIGATIVVVVIAAVVFVWLLMAGLISGAIG